MALGETFVRELTEPENADQLRDFLLYHIVPEYVPSSEFQNGTLTTLLDNASVVVTVMGNATFDNSTALLPDEIQACNGIGHVLDTVLMSRLSGFTPAPAPVPQTAAPTTSTVTVRIERFYMAYVSDDTTAPTDAQYQALVEATAAYYEDLFSTTIPGFVGMDMQIDYTLSGDAVTEPASRFNLYIEFSEARAVFTRDQVNPTSDEMITEMVDGLDANFLVNTVRQIQNSPFTRVNEGWVAYTSMTI